MWNINFATCFYQLMKVHYRRWAWYTVNLAAFGLFLAVKSLLHAPSVGEKKSHFFIFSLTSRSFHLELYLAVKCYTKPFIEDIRMWKKAVDLWQIQTRKYKLKPQSTAWPIFLSILWISHSVLSQKPNRLWIGKYNCLLWFPGATTHIVQKILLLSTLFYMSDYTAHM